jgi:hypothetical protein
MHPKIDVAFLPLEHPAVVVDELIALGRNRT